MHYVLDACSVVNLLHIDEDEFLLRKLAEFQFSVCKQVYEESHKNAFHKFGKMHPYPQDKHEQIERKLIYFRERIYSDETYLELDQVISTLTNYKKRNGEFFTVILAFYINTFERKYILMVTDDGPAKEHFTPYLSHHKVGYIQDTVDLLICLYRHCDNFSKSDLKKILSALYTEYACELSGLEKKLNSFEIPKHLLRNKDITYTLQMLKAAIRKVDLQELQKIFHIVTADARKFKPLHKILEPYFYFSYKNVSPEYLKKIAQSISNIETDPFYKFCEN
jgi:hypothetical protein